MKDLFGNEPVRALSWKEPFASLMIHGKIETRRWATNYRGLVLICASLKRYTVAECDNICGGERMVGKIVSNIGSFWEEGKLTSYGKAIAIGRLINCRPMRVEDEDKCFVKYYPDLFCHIYEYVKPITPFDWKGTQGWKILTEEQKELIK